MLLSIALAISRLGRQQVCIYPTEGAVHHTVFKTVENLAQSPLLVQNQAEF